MDASTEFPVVIVVVLVSATVAGLALWRASRLPTIGPLLPRWTWPLFWASAAVGLIGLILYAVVWTLG